jgi:hypothetical protein
MTSATRSGNGLVGAVVKLFALLVLVWAAFVVVDHYRNTHPKPTHPGNNRPATVRPQRPAPPHSSK